MKRLCILLGVFLLLSSCQNTGGGKRTLSPHLNFFSSRTRDAVAIGSAAMQFDKMFSSVIEKKEVDVWFDPETDEVFLQFKYQSVTYRQYWDKPNRLKFITALEKYKADYASKNLNLKSSRARRAYGTLSGKTEWGQFSANVLMSSRARPRVNLGYQFKQESPYFSVTQQSAENLVNANDVKQYSLDIITYFTRAQADELAKLFDQQYLLSFSGPQSTPEDLIPAQDDDYREAE
ncbi:hypothetical protein AGMMS49587_17620 [Spirochaetia bacterium]|nr:hypothetical protein AGMMS49587_17620 [Spirochaetia bacterium]